MNPRSSLTLATLALVSLHLTACEVVKGIFKAGVWVGVLGVFAVIVLAVLAASLLRR